MTIEKKFFKVNDLLILSFLFLLLILFINAGTDLVGLFSLIFVTLITFCFSRYFKPLTTILFVALCVRLVTIYLGAYLIVLPDAMGDAEIFELKAWEYAQDGFLGVFDNIETDKGSFLISWILALFYSLAGRSEMMGISLSLLFSMGSVLLGSRVANKIWDEKISIKVGWILALYPTLVLYSTLILREAYIYFFLSVALYSIVSWSKGGGFKAIIITFISFSLLTFFHGGMIIGCFIFIIILGLFYIIEVAKSLNFLKISINSLIILSLLIIVIIYLVSLESIPKLGSFKSMFDMEALVEEIPLRNINRAAYPEWTIPQTAFELIYKAPIRIIHFIFSPFPWDIKKISHILGFFDGAFHIILFILIIINFKSIWSNRTLRIIFIIYVSYILVFGMGTGNFGTGIRHRTKFMMLAILIVAPWIPKFVFNKKQTNINNKKL